MPKNKQTISFSVDKSIYQKINHLAQEHSLSASQYSKMMTTILLKPDFELSDRDAKNNLEEELTILSKQLEKKRHHIDLVIRSIYATILRLQSQFKKISRETYKELDQDFKRIDLMIDTK